MYVEGIYPFGMHAMIYSIRAFFAFNLREILLYAGAYQFTLLIIGIYILAKEIFVGKYSSIAVILITSLLLNQGRYAAALPQEIGMYAVVAVAYFMIRYLHSNQKKNIIESDSRIRRLFRVKTYINRRYISSELILLTLSVALVISYHYYTAFAAVFIIIAIGLGYIFKILRKQYFLPLLFCGVMGVVIAVLPTGLGLAKGIPFQESIDWALTVMSGEEWRGSDLDYQVNLDAAIGGSIIGEDNLEDDLDIIIVEDDKIDYSKMSLKDIIRHYYDSIYDFGFYSMYGEGPTKVLFICMVIGLISALIMFLYKKTRSSAYDYMALIIMMLIFFTLGASKELGIPEVIAAARASTFAQAFTGLIYVLPVDFIFRILKKVKKPSYKLAVNFLSLGVCGLSAFIIVEKGWYHNFFDVNVAYYNETEYVLRNIKKDFKKNSYTIVSPTDERYDVIDHGRHTELSQFVNMINGNEEMFTFTTDYVFFFIEKKLLQDKNVGSVYVSQEYAEMDFFYMGDVQDYYFQRAVIESKAYYWAKEFEKTYPRNFKVYFENDIYIVYLLKQNTYSPYNLQIRDK